MKEERKEGRKTRSDEGRKEIKEGRAQTAKGI